MGTEQDNATTRVPYSFKMEAETFNGIVSTMYRTSDELCLMINSIFGDLFADYEGCNFEPNLKRGVPTISLSFNHGVYDDSDKPTALLRPDEIGKSSSNDVVSRMRNRDSRLKGGDRYRISEDGKDILRDLLIFDKLRDRNKNGDVNWNNLMSEFSDAPAYNYGMPYQNAPQFTKVMYIDPAKILAKKYGKKVDGCIMDYNVQIINTAPSPMPYQGAQPTNFILAINRLNSEAVKETYKMFGLGFNVNSSNIIRGIN